MNSVNTPETFEQLETAYDSLSTDFRALANDLRLVTDLLLQINALLQDPAVAALLREREHEQRVQKVLTA